MKANAKTNKVSENVVNNLQAIEVVDNTTTKGVKPSGEKETANSVEVSLSKNEIFTKLKAFFAPAGIEPFNEATIAEQMQPLLTAGVITQSVVDAAITKARTEYRQKNSDAIAAAENVTFSEFLERLKANEKLYTEVLNACKLSEIDESKVFDANGNIVIYRGAQCTDKDGNARYAEEICKVVDKLGKEHTAKVYKELRVDSTVTNYIQAIRYYSTFADVRAKLARQAKECTAPLELAVDAIQKAMEAGFSLEDITASI